MTSSKELNSRAAFKAGFEHGCGFGEASPREADEALRKLGIRGERTETAFCYGSIDGAANDRWRLEGLLALEEAESTGEPVPCPACGGSGRIEYRISREMALDAGDPSLEGQPLSNRCTMCGGDGQLIGRSS